MKIKELFKDKSKILKFTILAIGITIIGLVSVIGVTYATSFPKFCAVCHIMKPEYATWEASSHSQISCVACHVDPGLVNALKHKVEATKELYMYLTKTYELPIQLNEKIPDNRCLQCHNLKRKVSPSYPDLTIPHQLHHDKGVTCVTCHQGVAHGNIESRGMTMSGDFNQWTKAKGTEVMTTQYTEPKMQLCMDCHGRRGVSIACETCHSGSMKPESHFAKTFYTQHGELAKKDINYCNTCHAFIKAPGVTSQDMPTDEDPVAKYLDSMMATGSGSNYIDYAKNNEFCSDCHKKKPPSHDASWPTKHGQEAQKDQQRCMVCHSPRSDVQGVTSTACSSCHPSIHEKIPWKVSHPIQIPANLTSLPSLCFQCHVKTMCSSCHQVQEGPANPPAGAKSPNSVLNSAGQQSITGLSLNVIQPHGTNNTAGGNEQQPTADRPPTDSQPNGSNNPENGNNNPASQPEVIIKTINQTQTKSN